MFVAKSLGLFRLARYITRNGYTIIGWHGVSMSDEHVRHAAYFIRPETLRRRLTYLKKHFEIVPLAEAIARHTRNDIRPRQVVLTFDDGMYDFYSHAAPVLREYRVPATLYVLSGTVESGTPAYTMIIKDLVLRSPRFDSSQGIMGFTGPPTLRGPDADRWVQILRSKFHELPYETARHDAYVHALAQELEVELEPILQSRQWHYITPYEMRALHREGFDMQVHTHTHRTVVEFPDTVRDEAQRCRDFLEAELQTPARHFCYPSGLWSRSAWPQLQEAGMLSSVTTNLGPNYRQTPLLALRRCLDGESKSQLEFEFAVSGLRWLIHVIFHPKRLFAPSEVSSPAGPYI